MSRVERCAERGCPNPPGTPWTDYWCLPHDEERRARITASLAAIAAALERRATTPVSDNTEGAG